MNENAKTIVFVGVAAAAVGVLLLSTLLSHSLLPQLTPQEMIGKPLVEEFDPLAVTDLEIATSVVEV